MKKIILLFSFTVFFTSCNETKTTTPAAKTSKEFKTAYINTSKLMEESIEAKDIEAKYKAKAAQMDGTLKNEATRLAGEMKSFESNAQKNGQAWAQQKYGELQQRDQQLQYKQQQMMQKLQQESGVEMDSLVSRYKKIFKDYGKEKEFDYVFGTGDVAVVLYADDKYDITKEIIAIVNEKYKSGDKVEIKKPEAKK